jgi:putative tricarboxylic transport membrane protein
MRKDLTGSLFWLALSAFVCVEGSRLKLGEFQRPGPGFFPFWSGLALGLLALTHLVNSAKNEERISFSGVRWPTLLLVCGAILAYLLCMEKIGFLIVTFLLLVLLFRLEKKRWLFATLWSMVATLAAYAFFQVFLQTQLPAGWLGF